MYNAAADLATIQDVCGMAARQFTAAHLSTVGAPRIERLVRELQGEVDVLRRAYITIEVLLSAIYVRSVWPHTVIAATDIRNRFRGLVANFQRAVAGPWGYDQTYNPAEQRGNTLPMLAHAFGLNKEVDADDVGWQNFHVGPGSTDLKRTARPALRSLSDPTAVRHLVLSCSLLSTRKCATAAPVGWIVNAPVWNIFGFAPRDIQFANDTARTMPAIDQARGITPGPNNMALQLAHQSYPTLGALIAATNNTGGDSRYNEIVVVGTSQLYRTQVQVTGIFVKVAVDNGVQYVVDAGIPIGDPGYDQQVCFYHDGLGGGVAQAIRACAQNHNLPLVPIVDPQMNDRRTQITFASLANGRTVRNAWNCTMA